MQNTSDCQSKWGSKKGEPLRTLRVPWLGGYTVAGEANYEDRERNVGESISASNSNFRHVLLLPNPDLLPRTELADGNILVESTGEGEHPPLD